MADLAKRWAGRIVNVMTKVGNNRRVSRDAAEALGKNRSDFMLDRRYFTLDAEAFAAFMGMLDQPLGPNPGLRRLLTFKAPWE
ncbi:MAG: DUF1778 domain-containing protein [Alphaproteobacteria bacterium]|nr:DUF1778 domain-containing protein [Alphaproteobacteria bacterium]